MSNLFVASGTVKGKPRRVGLRVGGATLDLDGITRHFEKHPFPVKFDAPPTIVEIPDDEESERIPLHRAVRDPEVLKTLLEKQNERIANETKVNPQPVENLDVKEPTTVPAVEEKLTEQ